MCGITAYSGNTNALPYLLRGLEKLEYRGYDSSGISLLHDGCIETRKKQGRIQVLKETLAKEQLYGTCGIAHTRWATHGKPSDVNAHPHDNQTHTISLVHNGIIENANALKEELIQLGYHFQSQTDSEVIVHLLDYYYQNNPLVAIQKTIKRLQGSYALAILFADQPCRVYMTKKDSPLILGHAQSHSMAASDLPALLEDNDTFYLLDDLQIAILDTDKITFYDTDLNEIQGTQIHYDLDEELISKAGFATFMEKEIHEQPLALQQTINSYLKNGAISLAGLDNIQDISSIYLFACGTAYHACLVASSYFEELTTMPCVVKTASEFRYSHLHLNNHSLAIFVSQSGETADTLAACKLAKAQGAKTLAITNVVASSLARICDVVLYTKAGIEIAVASTKAYTTQVALLLLVALHFSDRDHPQLIADLINLPHLVDEVLKQQPIYEQCATLFTEATSAFYIGRQLDYTSAMEGALKIKEISYIHAEAFAAGELKHGPIALIDQSTPIVALATQKEVFAKTLSNVEETIARQANVILLTNQEIAPKKNMHVIILPNTSSQLYAILAIVPLQILACKLATLRHYDVDKPRNLAKSVTVE